jgi:uncharacterized protein YecE (DUF72 family)
LQEYLIGTGGWAYFHIPSLNPLVAYSKVFNFVEVNSTFYQIPPLKQVKTWRRLVPPDFQFTVRAHRTLTHKHKLKPTQEAFQTFEKMKQICTTLNAGILHLQTSSALKFTDDNVDELRDFLSSASLGKLRLALETRPSASRLPPKLIETMQDHEMIHCVDLSKDEMPAYDSDVLYSRLFGKGHHNVYQPTDDELVKIDKKASSRNSEKMIMSFHFVRMYKDAARLQVYKQTGMFPQVTESTGLASLGEILREDASFPATKDELMRDQGWKLFDLTQGRRVRAVDVLCELPEKTYGNVGEVVNALGAVLR